MGTTSCSKGKQKENIVNKFIINLFNKKSFISGNRCEKGAGIISENPLPTFYDGFPQELLDKLSEATGRKIICNKPYSGTEVIKDYGKEHMETGALIVYTSADSVFQIAVDIDVIPVETLYEYCQIIITNKK